MTYRFLGHSVGDPLNCRDKAEVNQWRDRDPIERFSRILVQHRVLTEADIEGLTARVQAEIDQAVEGAKQAAVPDVSALTEDVYA